MEKADHPMDIKKILANTLKGDGKIAVLGIGSDLRGDDMAGMLAAERLNKLDSAGSCFKVFLGGTAPENLTSEIKRFNPRHLIIIDSADTGREAGAVNAIEPDDIGGISFSTHSMPLNVMIEYLRPHVSGKVIVIGIQPKTLAFGASISKEVERSAVYIADTIKEIVLENKKAVSCP